MAIHPASLPQPRPAAHAPAPWRERTLARLVTHVRAVLPVSAVAFVTARSDDGARSRSAGSRDEDLRVAMEASLSRIVRAALAAAPARGRLAGRARPDGRDQPPSSARRAPQRVWEGYRAASVIVCPVRGEIGTPARRARGGLARRDAAARTSSCQRSRPWPTSRRWRSSARACSRPRVAAPATSCASSAPPRRCRPRWSPNEVYMRVVEHAAAITGGTCALLTRLNARAGEVRTAAKVNFSEELAAQLVLARQRKLRRTWRARARR